MWLPFYIVKNYIDRILFALLFCVYIPNMLSMENQILAIIIVIFTCIVGPLNTVYYNYM
jgi:hypothetical protein